ncbi:hypothetical protein TSUD_356020 [Trifolium subterraneum]|uniref:Uncharacterized protein n=1 Tax=Trifolium subterraneum TaxID=3900 RepID=A0A2Z6M3M8_TRISU|nr:hypothetical protein TSUD_356020 [Trifolium subterraneum]
MLDKTTKTRAFKRCSKKKRGGWRILLQRMKKTYGCQRRLFCEVRLSDKAASHAHSTALSSNP